MSTWQQKLTYKDRTGAIKTYTYERQKTKVENPKKRGRKPHTIKKEIKYLCANMEDEQLKKVLEFIKSSLENEQASESSGAESQEESSED